MFTKNCGMFSGQNHHGVYLLSHVTCICLLSTVYYIKSLLTLCTLHETPFKTSQMAMRKAGANNQRLKSLNLKRFNKLSHPKVPKKLSKGKHHARSAYVEESSGCETSTLAGGSSSSTA